MNASRIGIVSVGIASLCAASPLRAGNINAAFIANEASLNETNPVFPGPVGGTLTIGYFGDIDNNGGTPDAFAAFLPGATPASEKVSGTFIAKRVLTPFWYTFLITLSGN